MQQKEIKFHYEIKQFDVLVRNNKLMVVTHVIGANKNGSAWDKAHESEFWLYCKKDDCTHTVKFKDMQDALNRKTIKRLCEHE